MDYPYPISYNNYVNPLTLNFKQKKDTEMYEKSTYLYKLIFVQIVFFWLINLVILLLILQNKIMSQLQNIFIFISFIIGSIILIFIVKCIKNNLLVDVCLTALLLIFNILIIEVFIPNMFRHLGWENGKIITFDSSYLYFLMFVGMQMKISGSILDAAKVRWIFTTIFNTVLNILLLRNFITLYRINGIGGSLMTITFPTCIWAIAISYFDERAYKKVLFHLNRSYEHISSFETLINNIPNQIVIISAQDFSIKYLNSKTKHFFGIDTDISALLDKLKLIKNSDDLNSNLIGKCRELLINENAIFEPINEERKDDFTNFNAVWENNSNNSFFFDIKIGISQWKNEKAMLLIMNDISSKIQFLKELNEYKDLLLASVSHDLRTPLNCIMGNLDLMEELNDFGILKCVQTTQSSCKILLSLINDILDYSQISNKKLKLNNDFFSLEEMINELTNMFISQTQKKKIDLHNELSQKLRNIKILGDKRRIEQILINLVGNAIKFTLKGKIVLSVSEENCELHDHNVIIIKVTDSGIGIDQKNIKDIFNIFKKLDQDDPILNTNGIGLGLFLSQNIAKMIHEPGITVKSEINVGSEFSFSIPRGESPSWEPSIEEKPNIFETGTLSSKINTCTSIINSRSQKSPKGALENQQELDFLKSNKIYALFVDDDVMNILIYQKYAESLGIEYEVAFNGAEGLEKIELNHQINKFFSLIFLDCNMPILNGFDTTMHIKELIAKKVIPYVPIVALTASVTTNDLTHCLECGMEYYLSKPVSKKTFRKKIVEILRKKG